MDQPRQIIRDYARLARRLADYRKKARDIERDLEGLQPQAVVAFRALGDDVVVQWWGMECSLGEGISVKASPDSATLVNELIDKRREDLLMPSFPGLRSLAMHDRMPDLASITVRRPAEVRAKRITDKRRGDRTRSKGGQS